MNTRTQRIFMALAMLLMLSSPRLFAQTFVNADFESGNSGFITHYSYTSSGEVGEGHYCIDVTALGHGGGTLGGWPDIRGYGGSGNYMLVNGFGGSTNQTKIVWKQTVDVLTNTNYKFSCQVVNLGQTFFGYTPVPAVLRLKINGSWMSDSDYSVPGNNEWREWAYEWYSGSATQAIIEIYDVCSGNTGVGDDFGIDHLQLTMLQTYSVNAVNDDVSLCVEYYQTYQIDVLANDIITPNSQISGATVQVIQAPSHGNASWNNTTRKINYMYLDQGYYGGLDQFKYRVTIPHGETSEAWVYVNTGREPSFQELIDTPEPICAEGPLGIPIPSVLPNQGSGQWVCSETPNGTYSSFDAEHVPFSMNGWYVKFMAHNDCGDNYSNSVQLTVIDKPTVGSINNIIPSTACSPVVFSSYNLPTIQPNGSNPNPATSGWQIQTIGGQWENAPSTIQYQPNGNNVYNVRYCADNDCGPSYSNTVQLTVIDKPTVGSISDIIPSLICAPATFSFNPPTVQPNGSSPDPATSGWQIQPIGGQWGNAPSTIQYQPNGNNVYNVRYCADNDCGPSYSNTVQITVSTEPSISGITAPAGICEGLTLTLTPPQVTPSNATGCWQVFLDGIWQDITGNSIPSISYNVYNGCLIRYKANNDCGDDFSNAVSITVYSTEPIDEGEITACDVIYHHGVQCNQTGPYTGDTIINGCTVSVFWYFILGDEFIAMPEEIQECDSYYWSRTHRTYYETGIYDTTIVSGNPMICDSTFTLNLTINHAPVITEQLESPNPIEVCSSIGVLNVTAPSFENGGTTGWEYATSEYGPWNNEFNPASFNLDFGSYWLRFVVDNDCADQPVYSNPVPFYVSEAPVISIVSGQMPESVCEGSPLDLPDIVVDWKNMNQSGIVSRWEISENGNSNSWFELPDLAMPIEHDWWIRYYAQNSCDGAILGPVRVSAIEVEDETVDYEPECDSIMCIYDEVYYYESTVIDEVIDYPCPHIRHHNLVVNHSDRPETNPELIEVIVWCKDEYVWHDRTYYRSEQLQVDRWSTTNVWGCDSIRELRLSFGDANEIYFNNQHGCDSYIWEVNDTISVPYSYDENEPHVLDTVFVPGVGEACDTYYYLDLVMGKNWEEWESPQDTIPLCNGEEWNGTPYYESQSVTETLTASTGCDSIVSRYLSVTQPFIERDTIVNCQLPYLWFSQGESHLFNEDGEEYTATLTSSETSCDSIVTIHFKLADNIEKNDSASVCEPFMLPDGQTVNHGGLWSYIIPSFDSCDTTVYLNVAFIQTDTLTAEPLYACNTITFNGITYGPGFHSIYYDTVIMPNGCISSVRLQNLTVKDSEQMGTISGLSNVYVASSLISGVYRYEIDLEGLNGPVTWSLSNLNWRILETGNDFCRVLVTTPGTALLTAHFNVEECGEMERSFEIVAGFFGVEDIQNEVRIFPNPTKGTVTIEAEGIESLRLINMMGQVLEIWEYDRSDSAVLNLNGYTPAVFLLEIKTVYGVAKKRLILCR